MRRVENYKIVAQSSFLDLEVDVPKRSITSTLRRINKLQSMYVKQLQLEFKAKNPPRIYWSHYRRRYVKSVPKLDVKSVEGYQGLKVQVLSPANY